MVIIQVKWNEMLVFLSFLLLHPRLRKIIQRRRCNYSFRSPFSTCYISCKWNMYIRGQNLWTITALSTLKQRATFTDRENEKDANVIIKVAAAPKRRKKLTASSCMVIIRIGTANVWNLTNKLNINATYDAEGTRTYKKKGHSLNFLLIYCYINVFIYTKYQKCLYGVKWIVEFVKESVSPFTLTVIIIIVKLLYIAYY